MHRQLLILLFFVSMTISWARGDMSINANTSLDSFSYDLEGVTLKLEKLNARWQLSPFGDGALNVADVTAKKLTIHINHPKQAFKPNQSDSPSFNLPERIKLPFPVNIEQGKVDELTIIDGDHQRTFNRVQFALTADQKAILLKQLKMETPWGLAGLSMQMATSKPFALTGNVFLQQPAGVANALVGPYDIKATLFGDLNVINFEHHALISQSNRQLTIRQNDAPDPSAAKLSVNGQISLNGDFPLKIKIGLQALNPAQFGPYPSANIHTNATLNGTLLPEMLINAQYETYDSEINQQRFKSTGKFQVLPNEINQIDIIANVANNTLMANGRVGLNAESGHSQIKWQLNLLDLSQLGQDYSGSLKANGTAEGNINHLGLQLSLEAQKLQLSKSFKVEALTGSAQLSPELSGNLTAHLNATALQYGSNQPADVELNLQGTRASHQLTASAKNKLLSINSQLTGHLDETHWQARLEKLIYTDTQTIQLSAPAPMSYDFAAENPSFSIQSAHFQSNQSRFLVDNLQVSAQTLISSGQIKTLAIQDLPSQLLVLPTHLQGDATFSGSWNIDTTHSLNGKLSLWRESGDLNIVSPTGEKKPLGLENVNATLNLINNQATLNSQIKGQHIGVLEANMTTVVTKTAEGYALAANSPLNVSATANLNSLAWLPMPPALSEANLDGIVIFNVVGNGTIQSPKLAGKLQAKQLSLSIPREGVALKDGIVEASFDQGDLRIQQAIWHGGKGTINTSGRLYIKGGKPYADLAWTADKFTVISRTDRLLTLSGNGNTMLEEDMLAISGQFNIDEGLAELASADTPSLSDDVVILGQTTTVPEGALKVLLNGLKINLGEQFRLHGRGLDAELTGALTFTGLTQYHPHTEGSIQTKSGTYVAYGQTLTIDRGMLNFGGTIDNPGLNIRAMRNSTPVNAGVEITGTVQNPVTKLVSDPTVTDSEKLSWLVLGHGMDETTKNDYGILSLAAGVILSQGQSVPLQTQIAKAAGLDELSFSGGDASSASVVFGKRLTSQLYLSYVKSISGLLDVARLTFNITPKWSIRAEAGTESAVDMLYSFSFK